MAPISKLTLRLYHINDISYTQLGDTLLKYLKEQLIFSIDVSDNPHLIDKPYTSLVNETESRFLCYIKVSMAQVMQFSICLKMTIYLEICRILGMCL